MYVKILTVTALNNYIKKILDNDFILNNLTVKGEVSNLKLHESGHIYFSLKDETGKINAVMFRTNALSLNFIPSNGMNVEVKGRVSVYPKDGSYQLYCEEMKQVGIGDLYVAFTKLKEKLEKEGLFDTEHKKTIPFLPRKIGVITSPSGAAIRDIIHVIKRRNKNMDILIYPSLVQGEGASINVINGLHYLNSLEDIDVIIIARGGGSIEELWAFNDEALAYEVFNSKVPVISGVGHETDFTIVDFVSDRRAPTPSAAAEIAVPSLDDLNNQLDYFKSSLTKSIKNDIMRKYNSVELLNKSLKINNPLNYLINAYNFVDNLKGRLNHTLSLKLVGEKQLLGKYNSILNAHNPLNVLNKGYAIVQDDKRQIVSDIDYLKSLEEITLTLKNGSAKAKIDFTEV